MTLEEKLRCRLSEGSLNLPLPGGGETAQRHRRLAEFGREDLSFARLAEAHIDAVAILAEAGRTATPGALYGVWASEAMGAVRLEKTARGLELNGVKAFCSGAGLIDRALVTVCAPEHRLVEVDLRESSDRITLDWRGWKTAAFSETKTATATFADLLVTEKDLVGERGWYLTRAGFWHGACGPASCWAGGALGLVDYALKQKRDDPHTIAHLGAMTATAWALSCYLERAGNEIDANAADELQARGRALTLRHLVDEASCDILMRFGRAYGPGPLAFDYEISRRCQELELYLRQCHAERDLEALGRLVKSETRLPLP